MAVLTFILAGVVGLVALGAALVLLVAATCLVVWLVESGAAEVILGIAFVALMLGSVLAGILGAGYAVLGFFGFFGA